MTPVNVPYLCGGIFFDLLLQARKPRQSARKKLDGGADGLSDPDMMKGLIYVVTGERITVAGDAFSKCTSEYKSCKISGNTYIPFTDPATIASFDMAMTNKNTDLLKRMSEFIDGFINIKKAEWLTKALLDVIKDDKSITSITPIEISRKVSVTSSNFSTISEVELQPFLLSMLHFIIQNRKNNTLGQATFSTWFSRESDRAAWKFTNATLGASFSQSIKVSIISIEEAEDDTEPIDAEVFKDENNRTDTNKAQIIINPTIVNQYGEQNIHIDHVENLKL